MGRQAAVITADPVFRLGHQTVMNEALIDFANSKAGEEHIRESAWARVQGIQAFLDVFDRFVQDGAKIEKETPQKPEETGPKETK